MDNIIEAFLDTIYSEPLRVERKYSDSFTTEVYYEISHKDRVIMRGMTNGTGEFKYIIWEINFNTIFDVHDYIPVAEQVIGQAVTNWVRHKCESQGILFSNILNNF